MFTDLFGFKKRKVEKLSQEILQRADAELAKITKHKAEEYDRAEYDRESDERFERQRNEAAEARRRMNEGYQPPMNPIDVSSMSYSSDHSCSSSSDSSSSSNSCGE